VSSRQRRLLLPVMYMGRHAVAVLQSACFAASSCLCAVQLEMQVLDDGQQTLHCFPAAGIMTILKTDNNPGLQVYYQGALQCLEGCCAQQLRPSTTCTLQHSVDQRVACFALFAEDGPLFLCRQMAGGADPPRRLCGEPG
jgi:hypothetical protein